ncbi:MAG: hypothetical protein LBL24_11930 [Bacteroidales bacterium]|nr:hypothetical protein [Bacteroidales bacterium]
MQFKLISPFQGLIDIVLLWSVGRCPTLLISPFQGYGICCHPVRPADPDGVKALKER